MLRTLVSLVLCLFLIFIYFDGKSSVLPVFQMTETPAIITKGQSGKSLIIELSYSHKGLDEWIANLKEPYPLFLTESDWMLRNPDAVKALREKNMRVGLLGSASEQYEENADLLQSQLAVYEKTFYKKPLWFATSDYKVDSSMQETLHGLGINIVAPTKIFPHVGKKIEDGTFISVPMHREQEISFEELNQFINAHTFVSIEQNIFGYDISTKRYP